MNQPLPMAMSKSNKDRGVYELALLTRNINIPMNMVGGNLIEIISKILASQYEGKCIVEGYVKPGSTNVITHSSGLISSDNVSFEVVFQCQICNLSEGMNINCIAKNITKAGIRGESADDANSPFIIFIIRDHHFMNEYFSSIKENDKFVAKVISQRYELNEEYVSIIGELKNPKFLKK